MKRTRRNTGFSIVEMFTVVGIIAILSALAYAALEVLPQRTRLTGGALEFSAVLSSARSHAYGRNQRVAVVMNLDGTELGKPIEYWVVVDPWSNLDETMNARATMWRTVTDLIPGPPAPPGSRYQLIDSGHFNPSVRVLKDGYGAAVGNLLHKGCTTLTTSRITLAEGHPSTTPGFFPPPFCFVPASKACTFCSGDGNSSSPLRGAVFFEPDGSVKFMNASGVASTVGAGSITFRPLGGGGLESSQAIVMTNTGLVRTFSAGASR